MTQAINKLKEIQLEEMANGFLNGELYNDLEDLIYRLENPSSKLESESVDMYGAKLIK